MNTLSRFFHRETSYKKPKKILDEKDWPSSWKEIHYKEYPRAKTVILPKPNNLDSVTFGSVLKDRKSSRNFNKNKYLRLEDISTLLLYSCGLINKSSSPRHLFRTHPSGGGRYPLEIYFVANKTNVISRGIYHYRIDTHQLELIRDGSFVDTVILSLTNKQMAIASGYIIISSIFERTLMKYGDVGYRFILEEAGAVMQNLYLVGAAIGIKILALAGVEEENINDILDFDGTEESMISLLVVGR